MHDFFCRLFNRNCAEDNNHYYVVEEPPKDYDGGMNVAPIPEPSSIVLGVAGALIVGYFIRKPTNRE